MKKKYVLNVLSLFIFLVSIFSNAQSNTITLSALPAGSEGNTLFTDTSTLSINASGVVSYNNSNASDDWGVSGTTITHTGALNKTFGVTIGGMLTVEVAEGINYGKKKLDGGIDRAADGALGIRGGVGNGIDVNEGINFGLNLTNLSSSASIQITKIYVNLAGSANESGVIVSRINPSQRIVFGSSGTPGVTFPTGNGIVSIDVSSFGLYLQGTELNNDMIAIFNNSPLANNFRVTGMELKVQSNSLDTSVLTSMAHPRLLLKAGEEALIQSLINTSPEHNKSHAYIIETANSFLQAPTIVKPSGTRILSESHDAIEQIFYLSYAYRMTGQTQYLTKAEAVMNDVCDWDNWITYSLDTSEMTFAVAIGYDWLYSGLSEATKQKAREKILNYGFLTQKTKPFWDYTSNWNQVCIGALACSALAIYGDGTTQMNTEAAFVLNNVLVKNPNSMNTYGNGNYPEGPMYWSYGTTYEVLMLSALEGVYGTNHEGINTLIATPGFLESAEYMQYVTGPTSLYFNYSDSTAKRIPLPAALWMAKKANKPSWLSEEKKLMQNGSYASNFENRRFLPLALIYGKDISLDNLSDPQPKLWKGYGEQPVVMVRTAWQGTTGKYMGIKGGTPTYSHAQMDGGFFVYDSQGIRWGMDFGKYDYDAQGTIDDNDFSQNSLRWDIFRVSNLSQNTISIKKASEANWQKHKVDGVAIIDEVYDVPAKRGAKVNMKSLLGLNNELLDANRSAYLVDESYLEVKDYISNGAEPINLYWNMATKSLVETVSPSKIKLTQGGKTVIMEIVSSNPAVTFTLATNRSTDPVFYNPTATADSKNPGSVMIGFEASIPANNAVTFTVTIKDDAEIAPSSVEPINSIVLDLPNPTTGLEGNSLYYDTSELHIDANGEVTIGGESINYAWSVYGNTNLNSADNSKFFFRWKGMGTTNINQGVNYGALLTPAGMDRASTGELGVRGGAGAGIDPNEGFNLGFDVSYLPNNVQLQLVKVGVSEITGTENGIIVNRKDTSKRTTFGGSSSTASVKFSTGKGDVNVESLGITLTGGETNYDLASLFNPSGSGSFRMNKFVFKLKTASYLITANANGNGTTSGTGTYQISSNATLIANASVGNDFVNWTENGIQVSANPTYTFLVTGTRTLVANFAPVSVTTITACNNYTWNGTSYTTSGLYTGNTIGGVIQKLNLTIIPLTTTGSETISACGTSYTWALNGQTYNASGNYTFGVGCNTATLALTLTPATTTGSETITQCGGTYTWPFNSVTYSASETVVVTSGCNTATLNLTITAPTTNGDVTQVQTGGTYLWTANGQTYTTSGIYTHVVGCNTATLTLTINPVVSQIPVNFPAFCKGNTVATATGSTSLKFYAALTGGLPLAGTTALATGKTLFVTETINSVESSPRVSRLITVNVIPATPASMTTTDAVLCKYVGASNTVTYTVATVATATSYLWSVPAGANVIEDASATDNVITVNFLNSPINNVSVGGLGTISARAVNSFDCPSLPRSLVLTAKLPTAPTSLTMTSADTTDHFNVPVPGSSPIQYTFSSLADLQKITKVGPYMGTPTVFALTSPVAPTAASYEWTLNGATQLSGTTSNQITVDFAGVPSGIGSLPIVVRSVGGCGKSTARTLSLARTMPGAPTALTLTNATQSNLNMLPKITKVGPYSGTSIPFTLTATPFRVQGATATSYAWILPAGVTCETANTPTTVFQRVAVPISVENPSGFVINSFAAISTPTNVITVNFNGATGTSNLDLLVFGVNGAGNSIARKLVLARAVPTAPTALVLRDGATVVTNVGPYVRETTSLTLTANPFTIQGAEATSYTWTLPAGVNVTAGATLVSGNTWTSTGTVLTLNFDGVAPAVLSLPLSVQAVNGSGISSSTRTLTVTSAAPTTPGTITTPTLAIPTYNPACPGTTTITVQVPSVFGVTYAWTVGGTEAVITAGQGTNSITIDVEAVTTTTLAISVIGSNGTGNSAPRAITIKKVATCRIAPESTTASKFSAKAYPNPSSSEFTIETSAKGAMSVKVYDMQGRLVEKTNTDKVGSRLAAGVYNVIVNQGANTKTLRVIKK